jgi:hypothetical protein
MFFVSSHPVVVREQLVLKYWLIPIQSTIQKDRKSAQTGGDEEQLLSILLFYFQGPR